MIRELKELFSNLNNTCVYVVLRNWDDIFSEGVYGTGHEDIDLLCEDKCKFEQITKAVPVHKNRYRDNYIVPCGSTFIRFDIRWVGDSYYPRKWEENMLKNRVINEDGIYVMSQDDYCFSLMYHALLQKPILSSEYLNKVQKAFDTLSNPIVINNQSEMLSLLKQYLEENSYKYVVPSDPAVFINWGNVMCLKKSIHIRYLLRRIIYRIKSRFL